MEKINYIAASSKRAVKRAAHAARCVTSTTCAYSKPKKQGGSWTVKVQGPEKWVWRAQKAAKKAA